MLSSQTTPDIVSAFIRINGQLGHTAWLILRCMYPNGRVTWDEYVVRDMAKALNVTRAKARAAITDAMTVGCLEVQQDPDMSWEQTLRIRSWEDVHVTVALDHDGLMNRGAHAPKELGAGAPARFKERPLAVDVDIRDVLGASATSYYADIVRQAATERQWSRRQLARAVDRSPQTTLNWAHRDGAVAGRQKMAIELPKGRIASGPQRSGSPVWTKTIDDSLYAVKECGVQYATQFRGCLRDAWDEVRRFCASYRPSAQDGGWHWSHANLNFDHASCMNVRVTPPDAASEEFAAEPAAFQAKQMRSDVSSVFRIPETEVGQVIRLPNITWHRFDPPKPRSERRMRSNIGQMEARMQASLRRTDQQIAGVQALYMDATGELARRRLANEIRELQEQRAKCLNVHMRAIESEKHRIAS